MTMAAVQVAAAAGGDATMLRLALHGDIRGLNPGVTRDGDTDTIHHHIFESLVAYDETLTVRPMLAESIETSSDLRRFEFLLREGVRFHNGAAMAAEHVLWSWRRMLDPETGWRCRSWFDGSGEQGDEIVSIAAPDSRTVVFELAEPSAIFLDRMASVQCFSAILHPAAVDARGELREPIGTGPYRLGEWRRGEYVELRRFGDYVPRAEPTSGYAGAKPALTPRLRFMIIPDPAIAEAALLGGDIDVLPRVPLHLVDELEASPEVRTVTAELLYWAVLLLQSDRPPLDDPRIRRAIAHAVNIEQVTTIATFDRARANPSAVPTISRYYGPVHGTGYEYDPAETRRLLEEAGYDGQSIRLETNRKYSFMFDTAIAVQAMLVAAGMNVELEVVDWATELADYFAGDFQMAAFGYSGRAHPVLSYAAFLGDRERNPAYQWTDETALALLSAAARTADETKQRRLLERIHRRMLRQVPIIGLYNEFQVDALRVGVRGYQPWALGRPRLWGVAKRAR